MSFRDRLRPGAEPSGMSRPSSDNHVRSRMVVTVVGAVIVSLGVSASSASSVPATSVVLPKNALPSPAPVVITTGAAPNPIYGKGGSWNDVYPPGYSEFGVREITHIGTRKTRESLMVRGSIGFDTYRQRSVVYVGRTVLDFRPTDLRLCPAKLVTNRVVRIGLHAGGLPKAYNGRWTRAFGYKRDAQGRCTSSRVFVRDGYAMFTSTTARVNPLRSARVDTSGWWRDPRK